jgi:site-specific DNA-methyltransferase (adenine-specific)
MKLFNDDCLKVLPTIPDKSIDLILTDPPYGTTACKWDSVIPFEPMWRELKRIIKDNSAIIFTASQPFTSALVMSNIKMFKYEWIWEKAVGSNFATVKYQPMKEHENILVFNKGTHKYYPIMQERKGSGSKRMLYKHSISITGEANGSLIYKGAESGKYNIKLRNPSSVQYFNNRESCRGLHPTQKPIALLEYLIKTYTNENDTVLDFTMGSGSTGVACKNLNRNFIGIELDQNYFNIAKQRIESTTSKSIIN